MKAIIVNKNGGPEVLELKDATTPTPKAGEALVRVKAIGLNFIDVYHRTGLYPLPLPFTPGMEAAGTVEAVGPDASDINVGDEVAYAMYVGAYAEYSVVPVSRLVKIPSGLNHQMAAAAMLQGMTAHYLTTSTFPLKPGNTALVHAAAGGVGLLLIQMAKNIGAKVIGTVSTEAKAKLAREAGADEIIIYTREDFQEEVKRITSEQGVDVIYDSVGKDTFIKGLSLLVPRGYMVLYGQSSGPVEPFDPGLLAKNGSLFLTRPSLMNYAATREELLWRAGEVLNWVKSGQLKLRIDRTVPLAEASEAHRLLEGRETTGKVLLIP
jgi:NADPH:quinone reductase